MIQTKAAVETTIPPYEEFAANFSLESLKGEFAGNFEEGINAAIECCDRHAQSGRIALHWQAADGRSADVTFEELRDKSSRFANLLVSRGVQVGDRVAGLMPRIPELLIVILGTWRAGAVYQPLFTAFGPKAVEYRVGSSEAKLVVTDEHNRSKLDLVKNCPPALTVGDFERELCAGESDFHSELDQCSAQFEPVMRRADDLLMMLFTSGTTGLAKGVPVPYSGLRAIHMYMRYALDLRPEDRYWNIADPGWAYGLFYSAIGPLLLGQATVFYDGSFSADSACEVIEKYDINNLAGAPTAYRLMIAAGEAPIRKIGGRLRISSSAGEPLNPLVIRWFAEVLDCPIKDHYGQTELGMILCNFHGLAHAERAGAMGLAMPGYRLVVLDEEGCEVPMNTQGILAVDREASPLNYFPGYWQQTTKAFIGKYYLTGDLVVMTDDGLISFVGRDDDIITSAGYRIGPFEVESSLIEHPAVAETAVIGKSDPERTEIVKAFVVLRQGYLPSPALAEELQLLVKQRLSAHSYPREVEFVAELPKTPSGKVQRFLLRQQELSKAQSN